MRCSLKTNLIFCAKRTYCVTKKMGSVKDNMGDLVAVIFLNNDTIRKWEDFGVKFGVGGAKKVNEEKVKLWEISNFYFPIPSKLKESMTLQTNCSKVHIHIDSSSVKDKHKSWTRPTDVFYLWLSLELLTNP